MKELKNGMFEEYKKEFGLKSRLDQTKIYSNSSLDEER